MWSNFWGAFRKHTALYQSPCSFFCMCCKKENERFDLHTCKLQFFFLYLAFQSRYPVYQKTCKLSQMHGGKEKEERESQSPRKWSWSISVMKGTGYLIHNWRLVLPSGVTRGLKKIFPGIPSDVGETSYYILPMCTLSSSVLFICVLL